MPHTSPPQNRPGRPVVMPPDERRRRILQAAEELFGASGYAAVSMDDIAQRCEMSKKTLYEVFAGKEELLKALIADVESYPLSEGADEVSDPAEALRSTLRVLARFVLSARHINVSRLVISESGNAPEVARHYHEQGMMRGKRLLMSRLDTLARRGLIAVDDVEAAADMLFGASIGFFLLTSLARRTRPNMKLVEARIAMAVDRFV
jgi:AcrR family transcriptional regulator